MRQPYLRDTLRIRAGEFNTDTLKIDTSRTIYPIKAIRQFPYTAWEIAGMLTLLLLGCMLVAAAIYYFRKKNLKPRPVSVSINSAAWAIRELDLLDAHYKQETGDRSWYYAEASLVIRQFISMRLHLEALNMTSAQLQSAISGFRPAAELAQDLDSFLKEADLIKFSRYRPQAKNDATFGNKARRLVSGLNKMTELHS